MEKDIMNHAFRDFVEAYAKLITRSHYVDLPTSAFVIFPMWSHTLRFINQYFLISFLPEPKLYSVQVKSEIQYRMKQFIHQSMIALDRIDDSFVFNQPLHNSISPIQSLKTATDAIAMYQQRLGQIGNALEAELVPWPWSSKPEEILMLDRYHALADDMRRQIHSIKETIVDYEIDSKRIKRQLHHLRQRFNYVPSFEFSPTGFIAVSKSLPTQEQRPPFRQMLSVEHTRQHSNVFYYDLDMIDATDVSNLRSAIAQSCQESQNLNITSGSLFMVCSIWNQAMIISGLDDDVLSGIQRSWSVERRKAVGRYEKAIGADWESIASRVVGAYHDYQRGTPLPENL